MRTRLTRLVSREHEAQEIGVGGEVDQRDVRRRRRDQGGLESLLCQRSMGGREIEEPEKRKKSATMKGGDSKGVGWGGGGSTSSQGATE